MLLTLTPPYSRTRIVSALPGRVRLHLPSLSQYNVAAVERRLLQLSSVRSVHANALTGNVLITFDPACMSTDTLLGIAATFETVPHAAHESVPATRSIRLRTSSAPGASRSLVSPSGLGFLLKGAGITGGLLGASSPLALLLGAVEAVQLLGDVRAHLRQPSGAHEQVCPTCGQPALPPPTPALASHVRLSASSL